MRPGPVAVTGPGGRLGRAAIAAFRASGSSVLGWGRPDYDLDRPRSADRLLERDTPSLVVHCAAWTDVDGCARDPDLARRRNGEAVGEIAEACARRGVGLVLISTNEVFDGRRTDGRGYREDDRVAPINPYGASKLAGEETARAAYAKAGAGPALWIVRTSWLYGPPGNDFPAKVVAAADRLPAGEPLRVVADEFGSPTSSGDLARALVELVRAAPAGTYHLVNGGHTSRAGWASRVLGRLRPDARIVTVGQADFPRASTPPAWGVLDTSTAAASGIRLRAWEDALDDQLAEASTPR